MSDPITAGITAGAGLVDSLISGISTGTNNRRNREFTKEMWALQNEYNHPYNQMQRFKEAGLNPHLIYGQGSAGNTSMPSAPHQETIKTNFQDAVNSYTANRLQQTQIDNMEKAQKVQDADIALKKAQTLNSISNSDFTDEKKRQLEDMFGLVKDQAIANIASTTANTAKTNQDISMAVDRFALEKRLNQAQIDNIYQGIDESQARIRLSYLNGDKVSVETEIERIKLNMWKQGINPNDNATQQLIKQLTQPLIEEVKKFIKDPTRSIIEPINKPVRDYGKETYKNEYHGQRYGTPKY